MILAAMVSSLAALDQHPIGVADSKHPLGDGSYDTGGYNSNMQVKNDWSYVKSGANPARGGTGFVYSADANNPNSIQARHWVDVSSQISANSKEFWFREGLLSVQNPSTIYGGSGIPSVLFEVRNSLKQPIASLSCQYSSGVVTYKWNTIAPSTGVVSATRTIGSISQSGSPRDTYGNTAYDVRIMLDEVAGFVQLYDNTGTLIGETVGATVYAGNTPNYFTITYPQGTLCDSAPASVRYFLLSTTTTFGTYAVPLAPKSDGLHSDMLSGGYTSFTDHLNVTLPATPVKLEASIGQTRRANFKYTSLSDIALPANFKLDAIAINALVTGVNADGATISPVLEISVDGSTMLELGSNTIMPNLPIESGKYQVIAKIANNNPATASAWNVTDLANFYAGIKLVR